MSKIALFEQLKNAGEDHEFYPTTDEIIEVIQKDIEKETVWRASREEMGIFCNTSEALSILDIGAGDGKVLERMKTVCREGGKRQLFGDFYAIEKSMILVSRMPAEITVVGTDFELEALYNKKAHVTFSNPPYSKFVQWCCKIIKESISPLLYLVIPIRWRNNHEILKEIKNRGATTSILLTTDFEDAEDRRARAKVDVVRVNLGSQQTDTFYSMFMEHLGPILQAAERKRSEASKGSGLGGKYRDFSSLKGSSDFVRAMHNLYIAEMAVVQKNYEAAAALDPVILNELGVSSSRLCDLLRARIDQIRSEYWTHLFSELEAVRSRMTFKSINKLMEKMQGSMNVDFTETNVYAVVTWILKQANQLMEKQFVAAYEELVNKADVILYKSNTKTFGRDNWRYNSGLEEDAGVKFALDYRIVVSSNEYGVESRNDKSGYFHMYKQKLNVKGHEFLKDLHTIINNFGFLCSFKDNPMLQEYGLKNASVAPDWIAGRSYTFEYRDTDGEKKTMMDVKAFQNGNMHIRFAPKIILAMNVEYGRIRGWLRSGEEAAEELGDPEAAKYFGAHRLLTGGAVLPALTNGKWNN